VSERAPKTEPAGSAISHPDDLAVGTKVCVWNQFLGRWTGGFEVAEVLERGYYLRRVSDRHVFNEVFNFEDVMVERRRNPSRDITSSHLDRRRH
jgi:hypothetical protein